MANLVPELRTDSLGRTQRRWVREQSSAARVGAIPAPSAGPSAAPAGGKRGTLKQRRTRQFDVEFPYDAADAELTDRIGPRPYGRHETEAVSFEARDTEVLDVLSVASPANAALLLRAGARTADEALSILHEHHLDRLVQDNSALTGSAEVREVPARELLEFMLTHPEAATAPTDHCVEAALIYASPNFKKLRHRGFGLAESVLSGELSAYDVVAVGAVVFADTSAPDALLETLKDINAGRLDCTATQLKEYLADQGIEAQHSLLIDQLRAFGHEWVTREGRGRADHEAKVHFRLEDRPIEEQKEAITYWNELARLCGTNDRSHRIPVLIPEGLRLWEAGVPAAMAHGMLADGRTVDEVIEARQAGVESPVSPGWL